MARATRDTGITREEARRFLTSLFERPGAGEVFIDHVSSNYNGDRHRMRVFVPYVDRHSGAASIMNVGGYVAALLELPLYSDDLAIVRHGGGMDMGWDTVHRLSVALQLPHLDARRL